MKDVVLTDMERELLAECERLLREHHSKPPFCPGTYGSDRWHKERSAALSGLDNLRRVMAEAEAAFADAERRQKEDGR